MLACEAALPRPGEVHGRSTMLELLEERSLRGVLSVRVSRGVLKDKLRAAETTAAPDDVAMPLASLGPLLPAVIFVLDGVWARLRSSSGGQIDD